jgi:hypothetical protein
LILDQQWQTILSSLNAFLGHQTKPYIQTLCSSVSTMVMTQTSFHSLCQNL